MSFFKFFEKYFTIVFLIAVGVGFAFPQLSGLYFASSFVFAIAIFLASLKVDFKLFAEHLKDFKYFTKKFFIIKVIVPLAVYFITLAIVPELALGALLIVAIPCGMTNVVYSDIFKGNNSLTLFFTVTTHLLSPILIPILVFLISFQAIAFDYFGLFLSLAQIVLLPVLAAYFVKRKFEDRLQKVEDNLSGINILLVASIVAIIIAENSTKLDLPSLVVQLIYIGVLYGVLTFVGFYITRKESRENRIAISLSTWRTNLSLGLVIASLYFPVNVLSIIIAAELVIDAYTGLQKIIIKKFLK